MATYLVTGGLGFIGSHVADGLQAQGQDVRILDNNPAATRETDPNGREIIIADINDQAALTKAFDGIAGCFHLAAIPSVPQSNEQWLETHRVNLTGTINVFNTARNAKTPVVYASSAAVYGDNPNIPLAEDASKQPLSAYGADKLGSELHAAVASHIHGVPTTGLRYFNVYGNGQKADSPYSGVISKFILQAKAGQAIQIYGDGQQTRDFIHVKDVVNLTLAAMDNISTDPKIYNICSGSGTSINELARLIIDLSHHAIEIDYQPARAGDILDSVGEPALSINDLNVAAQISLEEGLRALLSD